MITSIAPIGFQYSDSKMLPCKSKITDLVEPQEGQGIFVMCFIMQTPTSPLLPEIAVWLIKSQIYPAMQAKAKKVYNLFLLNGIKSVHVEVFPDSFPSLPP